MLYPFLKNLFRVRLALWAIDMTLPSNASLKRRFQSVLLGVASSVAAGVLMATIVVGAMAGGAYALYAYTGLTEMQSVAAFAAMLVLSLIALAIYAHLAFSQAFGGFIPSVNDKHRDVNVVNEIANGLLAGFLKDPQSRDRKTATPTPSAHEKQTQSKAEKVDTTTLKSPAESMALH